MSAIRNSCVARGQITVAGNALVYTVPANRVLLLKSVYMYKLAPSQQLLPVDGPIVNPLPVPTYTVELDVNAPGAFSVPLFSAIGTTAEQTKWEGWVALNAGDRLYIYVSTNTLNYWISGALLPTV